MIQYVRKEMVPFISVILVVGAIMLLLNYYTPMYVDDYAYKFSFADGARIDSVWDIFPSMKAHYYHMNSRVATHFVAQILLTLPSPVIDFCKTMKLKWYIRHSSVG